MHVDMRNGRTTFVGGYVSAEDKAKLRLLAKLRGTSVNALLIEMVRKATTGLDEARV